MNYFYLSDGTKLSALDGSGEGLVYRGPFVYRKSSGSNASSSLTLESAAFGGGRLTPDGALLYVTDYLGSVRAVVDGKTGELYKAAKYSAFGDESQVMIGPVGSTPAHALATAALPTGLTLRDAYTGKEAQNPDFTTGYTDFGARQYSPTLRRWMTPDPLSEKYYGVSPYAFCNNNPVNFVDPDGEDPTLLFRVGAGAIIGGVVSGTAAIINDKSFTEVFAASMGGAVDGAIGALGFGVGGKLLSGMLGGGFGNCVEQLINKAFGNLEEINKDEIVTSAAFGAVTGTIEGAGDNIGKYIGDFYNSDDTIKSMTKEIKDNSSRRITNKKAVNEAKKAAEESQKAEKDLVEKSTQTITNTWEFYDNLQDE